MKKIIVLLGASLLLAGCANNGIVQTTQQDIDSSASEVTQKIEDNLFYIDSISVVGGKTVVQIDRVEWLTEHDNTCDTEGIEPGLPECGGSGFLIQNISPDLETYEVSSRVRIETVDLSASPLESKSMSLQEFANYYESEEYRMSIPYEIIIEEGKVEEIREKYVP